MSIVSEITRLQGVKADILTAIGNKGVVVPVGSDLAACPTLIADISSAAALTLTLVNIMPENDGIYVVDDNGYIGGKFLNPYYPNQVYYNNFAIKASGADFSSVGLGQVTFVNTLETIGGRLYRTVTINGVTWMAENLDYKFSGVNIGPSGSPTTPAAWYYDDDEVTYGIEGTYKCGLLYNGLAVESLENNKSELIPGWHVATQTEWQNLISYAGINNLKSLDNIINSDWPNGWNGTDIYGFGVTPAGRHNTSNTPTWANFGTNVYYWTSTGTGNNRYCANFSSGTLHKNAGAQGFYLRLVKDSA